MRHVKFFFVLFLLLPSACTIAGEDETIPAGAVNYTLTFKATWSAETHSLNFPPDPHFSSLVGAVHNKDVQFWDTGKKASPGIESMAETGSTTLLAGEIGKSYAKKNSWKAIIGKGIAKSPGSVSVKFFATEDFPLLTIVSMLAPSPDWFTGIHDYSLMKNGKWIESETFDVHIYDAGTDSGPDFTSPDLKTDPKVDIVRFSEGAFAGEGKTVIGTFTLKKS